ncbi:OLC1v1018148C1 [Oldenlandia corymbosa var. corymbosa]|uniref:OLC1v1018148C1 n=1 Tax=Oldenlandia corymbosa var. corymbosa TaxID=529605 RepID=A0AAV1EB62_OLDCO|nr:OLC1v1018148C1 [Oldenlandia corymbosa var. corymbosa]
MTFSNTLILSSFILWQLLLITTPVPTLHHHHQGRTSVAAAALLGGGKWALLQSSIGITAMHMQLLHTDKVVIYDRTDFGPSNISLPSGVCRNDSQELALKLDCTAHSVEYDVVRNNFRPLNVLTDVWCSSGSVMPDGTLYQTGGFNDGERVVRYFRPCNSGGLCDWTELNNSLLAKRWYATNHALPDGRQIIVGGRRQFNYEFYPKTATTNKLFDLPFLRQTNDPAAENNLYPLVFLNVDGNLFIFANNRAILLNYNTGAVVKSYPTFPDVNPRSYPSTGSGVLLPLKGKGPVVEVLICGGAPKDAFSKAKNGVFVGALNTCGRISISSQNPQWVMETMPSARVMGDMLLLPNGNVLIINGAASGTAGWEYGRDPVLAPVLYKPDAISGSRFEVQSVTSKPRMYHSTAILLRDGRVLVGGSNPHVGYMFTSDVLFPTELSLEAFSPSYLYSGFDSLRPRIVAPVTQSLIKYGQSLVVQFGIDGPVKANLVMVTMISPSFTTHSVSMNQRLLVLGGMNNVSSVGKSTYQVTVNVPSNHNLALPGYYLLYVVHQDIPSVGSWVQLQ